MKKQLAVVLAILTLFVSAGCSQTDTQDANKAKTTQEQQVDKGKAEKATIGEVAGLGDTAQDWEAEFGHPYAQGDTLKVYKGGL